MCWRDFSAGRGHLWRVRFLLATLIALALTVLPFSGLPLSGMQVAAAAPVQATHTMPMGDCHGMPVKAETKQTHHQTDGRACAEHCMMQASAPQASDPVAHPAITNTIVANHAPLIDAHAPRAGDPPDTPPPRA